MSLKLNVHFVPGNRSHRVLRTGKQPKHSKSKRLPRVTRLMALAFKYEHLMKSGLVNNHADLANLAGVDRSHISSILRFRLLAPDIQEWLLNLPEADHSTDPVGFMQLRDIAAISSWEKQRLELRKHIPDF